MVRSVERHIGPGPEISGSAVLVTHLGLGDGIVQSGLAIALLARYEQLAFPAYPQYVQTFQSIFVNHPQIKVFPVEQIHGEDWGSPRDTTYNLAIQEAEVENWRQIRLGIYSGYGIGADFTKSFYEHAQVPYEMKWRLCPIAKAWEKVPQHYPQLNNGERRIFMHEDQSRRFHIRRQYVTGGYLFSPPVDYSRSVLSYAQYMIDCDEIHCIDSGFFWLADALPTQGRLYLHKYARWQRDWNFHYETYRHWNEIS